MKLIKKILINLILILILPFVVNAASNTYKFEIRVNDLNVNNITGTFDITDGTIKSIKMANGWENKTGLNNEFYFSAPKVLKGSYIVATIEVENNGNSYYQTKNLTYNLLKCKQDKYGTYYDQNGTQVNESKYTKACLNNNANLKSLSLNSGKISPSFDPLIYEYIAYVPNEVSKVEINATPEASTSKITSGTTCDLNEGINTCNVVVTALDKTTKTYTIKITRAKKENKSEIIISNFQVINADLQEDFNQNITTYNIKVHDNKKQIYFKFNQNGNDYTSEACDLSKGASKCLLKVSLLDKSKTITYTFNIIGAENNVVETTNQNTTNNNQSSSQNNNSNQSNSNSVIDDENNNEINNEVNSNTNEKNNNEEQKNEEKEISNDSNNKSKSSIFSSFAFKTICIMLIGIIIGVVLSIILRNIKRRRKFFK